VIELITVVAILGTVSVTALAMFTGNDEYRLDATAKKIVSDIRYAQQLAMDNHGSYRITFSTATDSYVLYDKDSTTTPARDLFTGSNFTIQLGSDIYSGVTLTQAAFGLSNYIEFDDDGAASSAGNITISTGSLTRSISVLDTGLARITVPAVAVAE